MVRAVIFLALFIVSATTLACAQLQHYSAQTSDGRVRFTLVDQTSRSAFDRFCSSLAEGNCDAYECYRIEVNVEDGLIGMTFIHQDLGVRPLNYYPSFLCAYRQPRFECVAA
jgi:hypothetical protein